jgi:DNA-binding NtrC family response regulator
MKNLESAVKNIETPLESETHLGSVYPVNGSEYLEPPLPSLRKLRVQAEVYAIGCALERTGWNRKRAAKLLSISYRGLLYKIRQHKITRDELTALGEIIPFIQRAKAD